MPIVFIMNHIIIIGAGIGGLYTANALIKNKIHPQNILIIDPRAGSYTRPGHIAEPAFYRVYNDFDLRIIFSEAKHIKELERGMYAYLCSLNVRFVRETFIDLRPQCENQENLLITQQEDGTIKHYASVSYVFDCSGTQAQVSKAVNRYHQLLGIAPPFNSSSLIDENPIPHHLIAHIIVPGLSHQKPMHYVGGETRRGVPDSISIDLIEKQLKIIDRLKALGWHYTAFPTFYHFEGEARNKACFYMEAPPNLPQEKQKEWISLLLDVYSNGQLTDYKEINPSVKYDTKPRIVYFKNSYHLLNRATFALPNWPTVIVGFDGLKGFDYRHASGAVSGMLCCKKMLECLTIQNGLIQQFDQNALEREVSEFITNSCHHEIIKHARYRQEALKNGYSYFLEMEQIKALCFSDREEPQQDKGCSADFVANPIMTPEEIDKPKTPLAKKDTEQDIPALDTEPAIKKSSHQRSIVSSLKSKGLFGHQKRSGSHALKIPYGWIHLLTPCVMILTWILLIKCVLEDAANSENTVKKAIHEY